MEFKDYYKTLGVKPDADAKAIKTAYRKLARKYHPDVSKEPNAEAQFKEVSEAYEALRDPEKRRQYDELRRYGHAGQSFEPPPGWQGFAQGQQRGHGQAHTTAGFSDFFDAIFGGGFSGQNGQQNPFGAGFSGSFSGGQPFGQTSRGPAKGQDVEVELALFLEDTLEKGSRRISYQVPTLDSMGRQTGQKRKTLDVKIPQGVSDGERIRLKGQGAPGAGAKAPAGDLFITIRFAPHPNFQVSGHDLTLQVPIAPWEAALGTKVDVPTLNGQIKLTVPAHTQNGKKLRIRGKGLPKRQGHGDLYAEFQVVMPERISAEEKALWQSLSDKSRFNPRAKWSRQSERA